MDKKVVVEYKTKQDFCQCCNQKIPEPKTSTSREFEFNKKNAIHWLGNDWKDIEDEEELDELVEEYVYSTISFFATSSDAKLLIDKNEIEKVKKFILEEVIK